VCALLLCDQNLRAWKPDITTPTEQLNMIRTITETLDDPFDGINPGGGPTHGGTQLWNNQVAVQYQGFMLTSHLNYRRPWTEVSSDSLQTSILVPLAVDGLFINGDRVNTSVGTCVMFPIVPNPVITVTHQGFSISIRVLFTDASSNSSIAHADKTQTCAPIAAGAGNQTNSIVWRVDDSSYSVGSGRLVLAHRSRGDRYNGAYRTAFLWGSGRTFTDSERQALEKVLQDSVISSTMSNSTTWSRYDPNDRFLPFDQAPYSQWSLSAVVGKAPRQVVKLAMLRKDFFSVNVPGNLFSPGTQISPYPVAVLSRTVNDVPVTTQAFNVTEETPVSLFQPHLPAIVATDAASETHSIRRPPVRLRDQTSELLQLQ